MIFSQIVEKLKLKPKPTLVEPQKESPAKNLDNSTKKLKKLPTMVK